MAAQDIQQTLLLPGLFPDEPTNLGGPTLHQLNTELSLGLTDADKRLAAFLQHLERPATVALFEADDDLQRSEPNLPLQLAGALLARRLSLGFTHLALPSILEELPGLSRYTGNAANWQSALSELRITAPAHVAKQSAAPLVLDSQGRLYLYKYWNSEKYLADEITRRRNLTRELPGLDTTQAAAALARHFSDEKSGIDPIAQLGAVFALTRGFSLIAGGPGTGKTTLIIRILRVIAECAPGVLERTVVAAPTGKAAMRLQESFGESAPPGITPVTLHRLLQATRHGDFRRNAKRPLTAQLVIVDEASMIDLLLLNSLLDALPPDCHLLLVGDENQLAAVEAGAVFPELAAHSRAGKIDESARTAFQRLTAQPWPEAFLQSEHADAGQTREPVCGIRLTRIHRFAGSGSIQKLSQHVVRGESVEAWNMLQTARDLPDLTFAPLHSDGIPIEALGSVIDKYYLPILSMTSPAEMLEALSQFRILTALRRGREGSNFLNDLIETRLRRQSPHASGSDGHWFPGRAIMITRNDYQLGVSNGDTGVAALDSAGRLRVYFSGTDGSATPRAIPPARLPEHAPAYALTIHKSQGSEFTRILLLLPGEGSPLLSRELIYTGITRAREHVEIWTSHQAFTQALTHREAHGRSSVFA